ncbi:hypothetical protein ACFWY9_09485 [Amycolatopsis sp. NPDC059027]|uniref:hypothetical protein n=1 Tax=Amycolatopsis sp. NPDC059027 TaxID=3346709 RepID=UPI00366EF026
MRKLPTWQTTRKALTATALAAFVTGGVFLSSGTASAATTLADSCAGSVNGGMGDSVAVKGSGFADVVRTAAKRNEIFLHLNGVDPDGLARAISGKVLTVGSVPQSAGGSIAGSDMAGPVLDALQNEWGLGESALGTKAKTLQYIREGVSNSCKLTTLATNYVAPSTPRSDPAQGSQPGRGGTSTAPNGGSNLSNLLPGGQTGTAPQRDYSGIPTATPGVAVAPGVRYPSNGTLPGDGSAPQFGQGQDGSSGQGADIRNAGNAESLASSNSANNVQLPMLLAVIVLAGVTAGLVRTWVLRRTS